jgi:hypothetical protein
MFQSTWRATAKPTKFPGEEQIHHERNFGYVYVVYFAFTNYVGRYKRNQDELFAL